MSKLDYTMAVIGGGPAGSAAAITLAMAGARALLASARAEATFQVGESLVPSAQTLLKKLGVWDEFLADKHLPCYGNQSAWGSDQLADTDFIRSPYGHGWHLDRVRFDQMMCRRAGEFGATVWDAAKLTSFERRDSIWHLTLKTPEDVKEVTCRWLVDCTGRSSSVAKGLAVERMYEDRLLALFAHFNRGERAQEDRDCRTLVESVPHGWFHTALLPSGKRVVTFFTDAGTPAVKEAKTSEGFLDLIEDTLHVSRILKTHSYTIAEAPNSRDARSSRLERFSGDGWIAAGDAATSFDPLSSQGILFGLYSGLKAGQALIEYINGSGEALSDYDSAILSVYDAFLANRLKYYAHEKRWTKNPFWQART